MEKGEAAPVRQPPRRLPLAQRKEAHGAVEEMHQRGIMEPSNIPWLLPVVLVKKKKMGPLGCVDYRRLNYLAKKGLLSLAKDRQHPRKTLWFLMVSYAGL